MYMILSGFLPWYSYIFIRLSLFVLKEDIKIEQCGQEEGIHMLCPACSAVHCKHMIQIEVQVTSPCSPVSCTDAYVSKLTLVATL